jgi:putative ABC transport system substrate-binding protein
VRAEAGSIPIVFVGFSGDPVAANFVTSLARPGGNLTGISLLAAQLAAKRVALLKEAAPQIGRIAVLFNPLHAGENRELHEAELGAQRLGLVARQFPARTVEEVNAALEGMARDRVDGMVALSNLLVMRQRGAIAMFATKQRIPTISAWKDFAVGGNLMTYGPNLHAAWQHLASYVDKLLKGAKPGDLPIEQPTKFELVINVKTAKALGLTIPPSLLLRADQVIE